jgi:ketosteroid isomerase-like protein
MRVDHLTGYRYRSHTSALTQQQVDQATRQQLEQIFAAYHDNWNKQGAAGIAALYTSNGVFVGSDVKAVSNGPQEIAGHYQDVLRRGITHHDPATMDQMMPLGNNAVMIVGQYHLSGQWQNRPIKADGHFTTVNALEGGAWKIRLLTAVPNPPPTPPAR